MTTKNDTDFSVLVTVLQNDFGGLSGGHFVSYTMNYHNILNYIVLLP